MRHQRSEHLHTRNSLLSRLHFPQSARADVTAVSCRLLVASSVPLSFVQPCRFLQPATSQSEANAMSRSCRKGRKSSHSWVSHRKRVSNSVRKECEAPLGGPRTNSA